jgi:hypothetical protein
MDGRTGPMGRVHSPSHTTRGLHALQRRQDMRADLVVGGHLPDLELPDHRRQPVRLSKLAAGYPLIVSFCRGYW